MHACLGVTYHLPFLADDRSLLRATAVTRGWSGHRIRVSTQSYLWRRKFSRRSCRDSNSQPFDHESGALMNKLSRGAGAWCVHRLANRTFSVQPWLYFYVPEGCSFRQPKKLDIYFVWQPATVAFTCLFCLENSTGITGCEFSFIIPRYHSSHRLCVVR